MISVRAICIIAMLPIVSAVLLRGGVAVQRTSLESRQQVKGVCASKFDYKEFMLANALYRELEEVINSLKGLLGSSKYYEAESHAHKQAECSEAITKAIMSLKEGADFPEDESCPVKEFLDLEYYDSGKNMKHKSWEGFKFQIVIPEGEEETRWQIEISEGKIFKFETRNWPDTEFYGNYCTNDGQDLCQVESDHSEGIWSQKCVDAPKAEEGHHGAKVSVKEEQKLEEQKPEEQKIDAEAQEVDAQEAQQATSHANYIGPFSVQSRFKLDGQTPAPLEGVNCLHYTDKMKVKDVKERIVNAYKQRGYDKYPEAERLNLYIGMQEIPPGSDDLLIMELFGQQYFGLRRKYNIIQVWEKTEEAQV